MSNQSSQFTGQALAPYSQEAEEAVLGAVIVNPEAFLGVASFLNAEDFFIARHAYIWEALLRISERNDQIDYVTLLEELSALNRLNEIGGPGYLLHLINSTPTSVHAEVYGHLVERAAVRRRLLTAADEIKALALDEQLSIEKVTGDSESRLFHVTERNLRRELVPMREAINDYFERMEHLIQNPDEPLGLPTGFRDLDELLGGLQRSDLLIFAGRPGMGKCVAEGTLIPTERGFLPIEVLKPAGVVGIPDDEGGTFYPLEIGVQTPDGLRRTSHFYDSGVKPTLRIQTRAGYSLTGTHVHPVLTQGHGGQVRWKQLSHLRLGDLIRIQQNSFEFYWDEITRIEDSGIRHCYDLCVPDGHAFVSNGIVSHNTSFLLSVALNSAQRFGARILIFTMEMGHEQLIQRFMSMETAINSQKLRTGQLLQQEWARFVEATGRLGNLTIFIDDTPAMTPIQMRTKCRRIAHEYGLDLVIVDYMQLMSAGSGYENNRVQEISYISRSLKELARELNVPIFSAAQLSRAVEQRQDKRPQLSDLRESGSIEQDADIVVFLYRDVVYNEATEFPARADLIVAKHRNGPTGVISLHFEKSLTKFSDARTQTIDLSAL
ncbi:MAG TPA: replicative DNA helicase [Phototrophicaceae bacterium]|nr:replicative DNA helicase [Phototrophicaceae bacterium]